ncbi:hypothetical protein Q5752_000300 [Cryptotrichosporon argae]
MLRGSLITPSQALSVLCSPASRPVATVLAPRNAPRPSKRRFIGGILQTFFLVEPVAPHSDFGPDVTCL